ncbi:MAG: S1/P1 nuclease [Alistipes sp.]
MKKLFILIVCLLAAKDLFAWGQKGHDITTYIAECHLTPEAAEKIDKILAGHSMVYFANWMDIASHKPEYSYSRPWHYLNVDEGKTYLTTERNPAGDVLTAVTSLVEKLKKGGLSAEEEAVSLKMLIHLVGDMHCPMHTGRRSDLGGNHLPVKVFGTPSNLHSAWDTALPRLMHDWSYTEWQSQIDHLSDDDAILIQTGEPGNWLEETCEICNQIYTDSPAGININYAYMDRYTSTVETQFLKGGYRLARLLNEIYQ